MPEETIYFTGLSRRRCLLRYPDDLSTPENLPLVIGLHGGGDSYERFISLWDSVGERPFIFAALEAPYAFAGEQGPAYEWAMWPTGDKEVIVEATRLTMEYIAGAVRQIRQEIGTQKVFLLGFSQGAILAYSAGIAHHHLFSGLICLSGPGLLEPMTNPFGAELRWEWLGADRINQENALPVLIVHGKEDSRAGYDLAEKSRKLLYQNGYRVTLCAFNGELTAPPPGILKEVAAWINETG